MLSAPMLTLFALYSVLLVAWALGPFDAGMALVKELLTDADGAES